MDRRHLRRLAVVILRLLSVLLTSSFLQTLASGSMTPDPYPHGDLNSFYPSLPRGFFTGVKFATVRSQSLLGNANTTTAALEAVSRAETNATATVYEHDSSPASTIVALSRAVSGGYDVINLDIPRSDIRRSAPLSHFVGESVSGGTVVHCQGAPTPVFVDLIRGVPATIPMRFPNKRGEAGASYSSRISGAADLDLRVPGFLVFDTAFEDKTVRVTIMDRGKKGGGGRIQWRQLDVAWVDSPSAPAVLEWLFYIRKE